MIPPLWCFLDWKNHFENVTIFMCDIWQITLRNCLQNFTMIKFGPYAHRLYLVAVDHDSIVTHLLRLHNSKIVKCE